MRLRVQADLCDYEESDKEQEILTHFMQGIPDQAARNKICAKRTQDTRGGFARGGAERDVELQQPDET